MHKKTKNKKAHEIKMVELCEIQQQKIKIIRPSTLVNCDSNSDFTSRFHHIIFPIRQHSEKIKSYSKILALKALSKL